MLTQGTYLVKNRQKHAYVIYKRSLTVLLINKQTNLALLQYKQNFHCTQFYHLSQPILQDSSMAIGGIPHSSSSGQPSQSALLKKSQSAESKRCRFAVKDNSSSAASGMVSVSGNIASGTSVSGVNAANQPSFHTRFHGQLIKG